MNTRKNQDDRDLERALGLAIRRLREHNKLTQTALARRAQVTQSWVSMAETAERNKRPPLGVLRRIAISLGLNGLGDLIKDAERIIQVELALRDVDEFIAQAEE